MMTSKFLWIFVNIILKLVSYISCEHGISLAFAIDDTRSMWDDIDQVKREAKAIMKMVLTTKSSEVKNFVLVTINDPDVTLRINTDSPSIFLSYLNRIQVYNYQNNDCAERSLAGIEKALQVSRPESYIYVFTDASTKELEKLKSITRLCQKKQSQVVLVLTGDCREPSNRKYTVYYDVAKACSGQVFPVKKNEVHSVLKTIEILLKGKNSIFKWKMIPRTSMFVAVPFTLDEKAEYAIVSTSGKYVRLRVTTINNFWGYEPEFEKTMWNDNGKVIKLIKPKPGTYYAWVKGNSIISLVIYGRTDFTFEYGFSVLEPKSMKDTSKQPIAGLKQHLSINVTDPEHSVDIKSAQILDIKNNDRVIKELPLRNISDNVYITEDFIYPNYTFRVAIKGKIIKTNEPITRNSPNIDPEIRDLTPESIPDIKIDEGKRLDVTYGSEVSLTCRVTAHPAPIIEWYDSSGVRLPSNSSILENTLFLSYLKINSLKKNATYICIASNLKGLGKAGTIRVNVRPVFTTTPDTEVHSAKYGMDVKIPCNIKSDLPNKIKWFRFGKELSGNSTTHTISLDGSELTLKSMNSEMQGKYTCEATLISDPTAKQNQDIEVNIPGLDLTPESIPDIKIDEGKRLDVTYGSEVSLTCRVTAHPAPIIEWYDSSGVRLPSNSSILENTLFLSYLKINSLKKNATYICIASNLKGLGKAGTIQVNVRPVFTTTPDTEVHSAKYGMDVKIPCNIKSDLPNKIKWFRFGKELSGNSTTHTISLDGSELTLKSMNSEMQGKYTCEATLISDPTAKQNQDIEVNIPGLDLTPESIPDIKIDEGKRLDVTYGSEVSLTCRVTAHPAPIIEWYDSSGVRLPSNSSILENTLFLSYLKINSLKKNATYICIASNLKGLGKAGTIRVNVRPVFTTTPDTEVHSAKYGMDVKIPCNIKSDLPNKIKWFRFGKELSGNSTTHTISLDGSELTLKSMNSEMQGKYTCEATLISDPTAKQNQDIEVNIPGLARPEIQSSIPNIAVMKGDKIALSCKVLQGYPKPFVQWFKKNADRYLVLSGVSSEVLTVKQSLYTHAGQYKCEAKNPIGTATATFDVTVNSLPDITIASKFNKDLYYDGNAELICKAKSFPAPNIVWKNEKGTVLESKMTQISENEFASQLQLKNIRKNATYSCLASNNLGSTVDYVKIKVPPPFEVISHIQVHSAKYGMDVKIPCNIKSDLPNKIKWFRFGKELSGNSTTHTISLDGSELTLKSMNSEMQGKYTCEATLISDPTAKQNQDIEVNIPGLARPEIQSSIPNIAVMKGDKIALSCKVLQGYPKPSVQWFKKNADRYLVLSGVSSEVLTVKQSLYTHAGQYKCEAKNPIGTATATFDVTVNSLPDITIASKFNKDLYYDGNAELICKAKSFPAPNIVWKNEKGTILESKMTQISENEFASQLQLKNIRKNATYSCLASNNLGSTVDYVKIKVPPPFEVISHIQELTGINYGTEETLICDIKSAMPMMIRWYRQTVGVKSSKTILKPSEKYTMSAHGTRLTIKSTDIDTAGKYTCEASLLSVPTEKITFSTVVKVIGLMGPAVTNSTTVLNERNLTVICRIKSVPRAVISWQFKPNGSNEFRTIPGSGEELNIPELTLKHTGVFRCIAINDIGRTHRDYNVIVKESPAISNEESNYYGLEGDLVIKIPCNVTGFPEPAVVWKKGSEVLITDSKYTIKGTTLYINNPVQSDSEEFTCKADNYLGNATRNFVVEVVDNFDGNENENFFGNSHDIYAEHGTPNTIKCNLKTASENSVRWYMDGMLTKQTGSTYKIEGVSLADEGNYTCRANTKEGSKSETYDLYVGHRPIFDNNSPTPETVDWEDGNQKLDCTTDSEPAAKYKWLFNGKVVETGNNLPQISIIDWGTYTCEVSNIHGTISKTFEVVSTGCYITMSAITQNQPLASDISTPTWPFAVGNSDILLKENEEVKFSCPNSTKSANTFKIIPNKQEIIAKCNAQDKFTVDGKIYRYSELQCNNKVEPSVIATGEQCSGANSEMIRVGFNVNGFIDAYKVCYDRKSNVPLYAKVLTFISRIGNGIDLTKFKWGHASELGGRRKGHWRLEESCKCCYTQGQLVNFNALAFGPAQSATFKENLNSVPIWNPSCDNTRTSWQAFDKEITEISLINKWSTWTGASEYVSKNGGLVPRFLWKVLNYENSDAVMVYVNDKSPVDSDVRCSSPCDSMMEADKFLYCCTLDEFSKKFGVPLQILKAV